MAAGGRGIGLRAGAEGTREVTDGTAMRLDGADQAFGPAEAAEAIVEEAERDLGVVGGADARAFATVLLRPVRALRSAGHTAWQAGIAIMAAAVLLRAAAFIAFGALSGSSPTSLLLGAAAGVASPFVFVAGGAAVILAVSPHERRRLAEASSLAFVAGTPIVIKAVLQAAAMLVTRHALHPTGVLGVLAPGTPALVRSLLAPVDLFTLWAAALVGVAVVAGVRKQAEETPAETS
jgi:hypothetical protein